MSRVHPSISAPAAPRTCAAVESSSPHGAMRVRIGAGEHRDLVARQTVDQRDLQLIGIGAGLVVVDLHELRGARAADHYARLVERADARGQRLIHHARGIEAVGEHGGEEPRADVGQRIRHASLLDWQFGGQLAISPHASSKHTHSGINDETPHLPCWSRRLARHAGHRADRMAARPDDQHHRAVSGRRRERRDGAPCRPGAAGQARRDRRGGEPPRRQRKIGTTAVLNAAPDGYTLLASAFNHIILNHAVKGVTLRSADGFRDHRPHGARAAADGDGAEAGRKRPLPKLSPPRKPRRTTGPSRSRRSARRAISRPSTS